eukprot:703784-Rhodomonas_salina.1
MRGTDKTWECYAVHGTERAYGGSRASRRGPRRASYLPPTALLWYHPPAPPHALPTPCPVLTYGAGLVPPIAPYACPVLRWGAGRPGEGWKEVQLKTGDQEPQVSLPSIPNARYPGYLPSQVP